MKKAFNSIHYKINRDENLTIDHTLHITGYFFPIFMLISSALRMAIRFNMFLFIIFISSIAFLIYEANNRSKYSALNIGVKRIELLPAGILIENKKGSDVKIRKENIKDFELQQVTVTGRPIVNIYIVDDTEKKTKILSAIDASITDKKELNELLEEIKQYCDLYWSKELALPTL